MIKKNIISLLNFILIIIAAGSSIFFYMGAGTYTGDDNSVNTLFDDFPHFPWCTVVDFVETEDGIYAALDYFKKIARYGPDGKIEKLFLSPSRYSPRKTRLAVDKQGNIYVKAPDGIYICTPDMKVKSTVPNPDNMNAIITWKLDASGIPIPFRGDSADTVTRQAVEPGDTIFTPYTKKRLEFICHDGSLLKKESGKLTRTAPGSSEAAKTGAPIQTYTAPWWLEPFTFPFPALMAWPLLFLWGLTFVYRRLVFYKLPYDRLTRETFYTPPKLKDKPAQDTIILETDNDTPSRKSLIFRSPASLRIIMLPLIGGGGLVFIIFYFIYISVREELHNPKYHLEPGPLELPFIITILLPLIVIGIFAFLLVIWGGFGYYKITVDSSTNMIHLRKQFRMRLAKMFIGADYGRESFDLGNTKFLVKPPGKGLIPNPNGYLILKHKLSRLNLVINNNIDGKTKVLEFIKEHSRDDAG